MVYFPDWIASLFNARCPFCRTPFGERAMACMRCIGEIMKLEGHIEKDPRPAEVLRHSRHPLSVYTLAAYDGWVKNLILANKTDPNPHVIRFLARVLWKIVPETAKTLPLAWTPGKTFGALHLVEALAVELGRQGARLMGRPAFSRTLIRSHPQKKLGILERKAAGRAERFRVCSRRHRPTDVREVILLDDVYTTGATLSGLARALEEKAGVRASHALVIAHTPLRMGSSYFQEAS